MSPLPWHSARRASRGTASTFLLHLATVTLVALALVLPSCSSDPPPVSAPPAATPVSPTVQPSPTKLFSRSITGVTIEIDYAPGAEPFEGSLKNFGPIWDVFRSNVLAVFDGKKTVTFPRTLDKMEKLDDVPAKNFSNQDLLDVAAAHRTAQQYENDVAFYIVFVDGFWLDAEGTERKDIVSVSVGGTGIIGVFKPAITTSVGKSGSPPELVEQVALIHGFGHAVGFVDNGVPVADNNKAHVDGADGHHCTNTQCAMNVANETVAGANAFARSWIRGTQVVILGQECLSDARILENKQLGQ